MLSIFPFLYSQRTAWVTQKNFSDNSYSTLVDEVHEVSHFMRENSIFWHTLGDISDIFCFDGAPFCIYAKWDFSLLKRRKIWIVWPRLCSDYQRRTTSKIVEWLSWTDWVTISWWARWIDVCCHTVSISSKVPTILVLWMWFWTALSSWLRTLIWQVVAHWWLVLSQFKLFQWPAKWTFPLRNKVIAWLSDSLFIPWAGKMSWTLLTVKEALRLWKSIYCAPWSLYDPLQVWTNEYLSCRKVTFLSSLPQFFTEIWIDKNSDVSVSSQWIPSAFKNVSYGQELNVVFLKRLFGCSDEEIYEKILELELLWVVQKTGWGVWRYVW